MSNANRIHKRFAAVVIGTAMTVSLIPCLSTAEAEKPQVDGEEITTTDDPHVVAEHIEEHWERGTYSTEGSDFQLERIIVRTDGDIDDSYGAEDALHFMRKTNTFWNTERKRKQPRPTTP